MVCREFGKTIVFRNPIRSVQRIYVPGPLQLPGLGGRVLEQFVRTPLLLGAQLLWRCGRCRSSKPRDEHKPPLFVEVSVAGFGQLFNSRGQILAPVIFRGGVPDVLLRLPKCGVGSITTSSLLLPTRRLPA